MTLPIFNFMDNTYSGENVVLEQDIFNQNIRRDIIQQVLLFNMAYNRRTFAWVRTKGEVSGSNRKPFRQKKTGRAPQGDIRAPNLYHGGRAFGARPRDYYFPLNKKIRLFGLKSVLTSKYLENKIIIVDSEKLNFKEKYAYRYLPSLNFLKGNKCLFITSSNPCETFSRSIKNFNFVSHNIGAKFNVSDVIKNQFVIFTKDGLDEFVTKLKERTFNYYRNKKIVIDPINAKKTLETDKFSFDFDPNKKLIIHTPALKGSIDEIVSHFREPEKKIKEILDRREKKQQEIDKEKENKKLKNTDIIYADNNAVEKRRQMMKKERRIKLQKDTRRMEIKKKKQLENKMKLEGEKKKK